MLKEQNSGAKVRKAGSHPHLCHLLCNPSKSYNPLKLFPLPPSEDNFYLKSYHEKGIQNE